MIVITYIELLKSIQSELRKKSNLHFGVGGYIILFIVLIMSSIQVKTDSFEEVMNRLKKQAKKDYRCRKNPGYKPKCTKHFLCISLWCC